MMRSCLLVLLTIVLLASPCSSGEPGRATLSPMTLRAAVEYALAHHPILRGDAARSDAASDNLEVARAELIPRGDISLQENRATGNVVPGSRFSMEGIPTVSGPPTDRVFDSGVWGSTAGLSVWWDVAHLTEQMRLVDAALADRAGARADYIAGQLDVAFSAADSFAALVEADDDVKAARAGVERAQVFQKSVDALVGSGMRPGADGARAAAETALAQTELIHAEELKELGQARLAAALGAAGETITIVSGALSERPPEKTGVTGRVSTDNPLVASAEQAARAAAERKRAAALEYIPRVQIVAALWGSGSGLFPGGAKLVFGQGAVPDTPNWASGVVVSIPILEYAEIHARADLAAARARAAAAHRDAVVQQVQEQVDSATAVVRNAYRNAEQARISLESSRAALSQAQARYQAGLYTIDTVAEALRLVAQAEAGDAIARTEIWRARMLLARAIGDLDPLMAEISSASGGR